jgi:hypothetical protein
MIVEILIDIYLSFYLVGSISVHLHRNEIKLIKFKAMDSKKKILMTYMVESHFCMVELININKIIFIN